MRKEFDIEQYWRDVLCQDADALCGYFTSDARVHWHNTSEHFTVEEFIYANCAYPGNWRGEIEKCIYHENLIITVVHVFDTVHEASFHVTSFIYLSGSQIQKIDEYWGDDGDPPSWRKKLNIGQK